MRLLKYFLIALVSVILVIFLLLYGRAFWYPLVVKVQGKKTVQDIVELYEAKVDAQLSLAFSKVSINYPPTHIALIAYKETDVVELWARSGNSGFIKVQTYPILAASGVLGPKLTEGDRQVPEGIYKVIGLNPNSSYHLSMKLNYPNEFDLQYAELEGRTSPGSNIFIHGKEVSIGCLAMGDDVAEQLFILFNKIGLQKIEVLITPYDPSKKRLIPPLNSPEWTSILYNSIEEKYQEITGKIPI